MKNFLNFFFEEGGGASIGRWSYNHDVYFQVLVRDRPLPTPDGMSRTEGNIFSELLRVFSPEAFRPVFRYPRIQARKSLYAVSACCC